MTITDLFSHKIHSSGEDWPQKLIEIATVFSKFDGLPYNRAAIEESFTKISPRASIVARDPSKYRDEISAYPAYLGLYRIEDRAGTLYLRLSETAKRFLIVEEPNVAAFMLIQLAMFQYPNGNGASYANGNVRLQRNAGDRTLNFINAGIHLSPFRLICKALLADSILSGIDSLHPRVSVDEISILCNDSRINKYASPKIDDIVAVLSEIRTINISPIPRFERRFHILNHTDLVEVTNGWLHLRPAFSSADGSRLIKLLHLISNIENQFNEFDNITTIDDLTIAIRNGSWSRYFDGVAQLPSDIVQEISGQHSDTMLEQTSQVNEGDELISDNKAIVFKYPLRERGEDTEGKISVGDYQVTTQSDPEVTRIKRQKSNLQHKILLSQLDEHLRELGAIPMENEHIDLYAEIPNDGSYLFEVKSVTSENLLSQTRKGLSQLYEYRFRYSDNIRQDVILCLIYPKEPNEIEWLQNYLCNDRNIAVAWFEENRLCFPSYCLDRLQNLTTKQ